MPRFYNMIDTAADLPSPRQPARHELIVLQKRLLRAAESDNLRNLRDVSSDGPSLTLRVQVLALPEQTKDPGRCRAYLSVVQHGGLPGPKRALDGHRQARVHFRGERQTRQAGVEVPIPTNLAFHSRCHHRGELIQRERRRVFGRAPKACSAPVSPAPRRTMAE